MSKRILFAVTVILWALNVNAQTQVYEAKQLKATDSLKLKDKWIKSILTDTALTGATARDVASADAIIKYIANRLSYGVKYGDTVALLSGYARLQRMLDSLAAVQARIQTKQPLGSYLVAGNNLADVTNTTTARNNLSAVGTADTSGKWVGIGWLPSLEKSINKATDFSTVNNTLYPTVQAAKNYADGLVVGLLNDRGNYDASSNAFPSSGGSGTAGAILKGNMWYISVTGTLGSKVVNVGDWIRALSDAPGQISTNWGIVNAGLGFTPENNANKSDNSSLGTSTILYPTQRAVKVYTDAAISALVTGVSSFNSRVGAVVPVAGDYSSITETLTNKTISGANNTLTNIANSSLTNNSLTIGSTNIPLGTTVTSIGGLTTITSTNLSGTLTTVAQPNITSLGTLSAVTVNGGVTILNGNSLILKNAGNTLQTTLSYDGASVNFAATVSTGTFNIVGLTPDAGTPTYFGGFNNTNGVLRPYSIANVKSALGITSVLTPSDTAGMLTNYPVNITGANGIGVSGTKTRALTLGNITPTSVSASGGLTIAGASVLGTNNGSTLSPQPGYAVTIGNLTEGGSGLYVASAYSTFAGDVTATTVHAKGPAGSGGTVTTSGVYEYRTFTSSGTYTPDYDGVIEVTVVGGGGAGANGGNNGGGGGGGQVVNALVNVHASTAYTVTVGSGGTHGNPGSAGTMSAFAWIYAQPGSGGQAIQGGSSTWYSGAAGNNGTGYGGGGAGSFGSGSSNTGGTSMKGVDNNNYGGGGGGAGSAGGNSGGSGGGGAGCTTASCTATNGTANTGGGGGGSVNGTGGNGGSGVVIIRYIKN